MGNTLYIRCALAWLLCGPNGPQDHANAANLRPFRELPGGVVRLSDLFDRLGETTDRELGPSPAPGDRIVVEAPQLAAIARDFGVAWRPRSGTERAVLERGGVAFAQTDLMAVLRPALIAAGAPQDADIDLPGFVPPMLPTGSAARASIASCSYDSISGRFEAALTVAAADMAPVQERLVGTVAAVVRAAVLTHHLQPGAIITAEDLRPARVRASLLRGNVPVAAQALVGMALRHDVPAGQALVAGDVARPVLVARNETVRMNLDAGGISLSAQGVALEEGALGDHVRVQNPSSRAVVLAEVTGDGEVRVVPGRTANALAAVQ